MPKKLLEKAISDRLVKKSTRNLVRYPSRTSSNAAPLLLSPAEATKILRANEQTVDIESKCAIEFYDVNYLGANNPSEDRQAQAKYLHHSDLYLFGVFDGHGGYYCSDSVSQRLFDYVAVNLLTSKQLEDKLKWSTIKHDSPPPAHALPVDDYPLWYAFQSTYKDMRSQRLKELQKQSLRLYAEELLKERIMEESMGQDLESGDPNNGLPNISKVLTNAFLKLDNDLLNEALPNPGSGKMLDRETMNVAMSGSCACVALISKNDLYVANCGVRIRPFRSDLNN